MSPEIEEMQNKIKNHVKNKGGWISQIADNYGCRQSLESKTTGTPKRKFLGLPTLLD